MTIPAPASPEAIAIGCTCSPEDNHDGRGFLCDGFRCYLVANDCPVHGSVSDNEQSA